MTEKDKKSPLSETELEVLKVLWEVGSGTVREINDLLGQRKRRWAHTTVLTWLTRLEAKGYVESDKSSFAHVFRPLVSRDDLLRQRLVGLAEELCEGTTTPLVHALVQGQRFSADEIKNLRRLLDERQPQTETPPRKSPRKPKS
ncbi:MAG TPA: BlaI/MecI/CopY family transcriptional regulator [Pirellulales bacterium]|jgi:predicted transcriptional regulator|nr:BlaI/MecI/CopY family transcriptional regulator [Pirellulales bacterium]